jgi:hypothetical protein
MPLILFRIFSLQRRSIQQQHFMVPFHQHAVMVRALPSKATGERKSHETNKVDTKARYEPISGQQQLLIGAPQAAAALCESPSITAFSRAQTSDNHCKMHYKPTFLVL